MLFTYKQNKMKVHEALQRKYSESHWSPTFPDYMR